MLIYFSENFQYSLCRLTGNQSAVDFTNLHITNGEVAPLLVIIAGWSSLEARLAHNQEVEGSNPSLRNSTIKRKNEKRKEYIQWQVDYLLKMID